MWKAALSPLWTKREERKEKQTGSLLGQLKSNKEALFLEQLRYSRQTRSFLFEHGTIVAVVNAYTHKKPI